MIIIMPMCPEHLEAVAEIEKICFSVPWSLESLELMLSDRVIALVALDSGRPVGYVGMLCVLDEGQIMNLAVHPDSRRQGIAGMLMSSVECYAGKAGIKSLSLEVRVSNHAARALYSSLNWSEAGIRKGFYSHPVEDAYVMTKEI